MIENEMTVSVPLEVVKASEIEPKEVKWLWYPYIPFGKVTLLQGDPGDGKSKLMLSVAALLSKGEPLPFTETEENEPMTIIYQTTEDDADDTVVPRFNSADGNGENLEAAGFKKSTIKKAKKNAGVISRKKGFLWYWSLPMGDIPKE